MRWWCVISILALNGTIMQSFVNLALSCPLGYEGRTLDASQKSGQWAYASIMPVSSVQTLQTVDKYIRLLQVDCNDQMNAGTAGIDGLVDQVMNYYYPRRLFTYNGQGARVTKSDDSALRIFGGYQSVAVTIRFVSAVGRPFS
jgi:hypothetical protein